MKSRHSRILIVCFLCLSSAVLGRGQDSAKTPASGISDISSASRSAAMTPEEKIIRLAYKKLAVFNRAARLYDTKGDNQSLDNNLVLAFELKSFHIGPIQEILGSRCKDLATLPTGEIIRGTHGTIQFNGGEEQVSYSAKWTSGQYASGYDPQWTIGDRIQFEPDKYYDVGRYASYEVTVSYEGKTRTYRALTLFHNSYGSSVKLKPEFWDSIVGMGGTLTQFVYERRQPFGLKNNFRTGKGAPPSEVNDYNQLQNDLDLILAESVKGVSANPSYNLQKRSLNLTRTGIGVVDRRALIMKAGYNNTVDNFR